MTAHFTNEDQFKMLDDGLVAESLSKVYGNRRVLTDVSIRVNRGEIVGLLGPNGAGKTTCFSIISGLVTPTTGQVKLHGTNITHLPMYRRARLGISYLPQDSSIFRGLNVEDNIMAILEVAESNREARYNRLNALLQEFSLTSLRKSSALSLSGGERRRVEIARCLAINPQFLLLDEPLAGIDPIAVEEIRQLIFYLKKRGLGLLITDHNVRETLELVDNAYIISDGQVLMHGTAKEVINHREVRRVYLGETFSL